MTHVRQRIELALPRDLVDHGWQVKLAHLLEAEIPELWCFYMPVVVLPAVLVASVVAQPHVIALVSQKVGQALALFVDHPGVTRIEKTVLQQNTFLLVFGLGLLYSTNFPFALILNMVNS